MPDFEVVPEVTTPEISRLYISMPLVFEEQLNRCVVLILYDNGELGRVDCATSIWEGENRLYVNTTEVVAYGHWVETPSNVINVRFSKCKCFHCKEFSNDYSNAMPVNEEWKVSGEEQQSAGSKVYRNGNTYEILDQRGLKVESPKDLNYPLSLKTGVDTNTICSNEDFERF